MATLKLSQIAPASAPHLTDTVVGVQSGATDAQYTLAQIQSIIGGRTILTGDTNYYVADFFGTLTGGTLYTTGAYLGVSLTGGHGSGATADIIIQGGSVILVSLVSEGAGGYLVGDSLTAPAASIGGTGSGFAIAVALSGSDLTGNGSLAKPYATLQKLMNFVSSSIDGGSIFNVFLNVGAGSFRGVGNKPCVGVANLLWEGAGSGTCTITTGPNDGVFNLGECFATYNPIDYVAYYQGFRLHQTTSGVDNLSAADGLHILFDLSPNPADIKFTVPNNGVTLNNFCVGLYGEAEVAGSDITVHGAGQRTNGVFNATQGGRVAFAGTTTISGNPTYDVGYAQIANLSIIANNNTIVGTFVGHTYRFIEGGGFVISPTPPGTLPATTSSFASINGFIVNTGPGGLWAYNTFTDTSNYERAIFDWMTANILTIGTQAAGTGTARNVYLTSAGSQIRFLLNASTVAALFNANNNSVDYPNGFFVGFEPGFTGTPEVSLSEAAAKVLQIGDTGINRNGWVQWSGERRVSSQFDKTADTSLATVTGLSVSLQAGRTYSFRSYLHVSPDAVGGHKYAIGTPDTLTATAIIYQVNSTNNSTNANIINSRQTTLGGSVGVVSGTSDYTEIAGTITVNAAGTLSVQFAQNVASGTSSVLVGSFMIVHDMP